jgi:hypothetical protein
VRSLVEIHRKYFGSNFEDRVARRVLVKMEQQDEPRRGLSVWGDRKRYIYIYIYIYIYSL